jgi:nucleoside 2-deoxyribosyltransferase
MNLCLVGSMRDMSRIQEIALELKQRHHHVLTPMDLSEGKFADKNRTKSEFMKGMFEQIKQCEAVLAVNDSTRAGIKGYIGPNTFLQLGMAMALGKPLFCLAKWDEHLPYKEELDAMNINQLDLKLPF